MQVIAINCFQAFREMTEDVVITKQLLELGRELILNSQDEELYEFDGVMRLLLVAFSTILL